MFNEDWYSNVQCGYLKDIICQLTALPGTIIEVGCWEGKSTIAIANACFPEKVICNDTWLGNIEESKLTKQEHITETILKTETYTMFLLIT